MALFYQLWIQIKIESQGLTLKLSEHFESTQNNLDLE